MIHPLLASCCLAKSFTFSGLNGPPPLDPETLKSQGTGWLGTTKYYISISWLPVSTQKGYTPKTNSIKLRLLHLRRRLAEHQRVGHEGQRPLLLDLGITFLWGHCRDIIRTGVVSLLFARDHSHGDLCSPTIQEAILHICKLSLIIFPGKLKKKKKKKKKTTRGSFVASQHLQTPRFFQQPEARIGSHHELALPDSSPWAYGFLQFHHGLQTPSRPFPTTP